MLVNKTSKIVGKCLNLPKITRASKTLSNKLKTYGKAYVKAYEGVQSDPLAKGLNKFKFLRFIT